MSFLSTKWKVKSKAKAPADPPNNNASAAGIATHVAEIGNMNRTHFEGAMTPTQLSNEAHLNTVVPAPKAPSTASKAPRFTNAGAGMGNMPPPASVMPAFSISQYANNTPQPSQNAGYPSQGNQYVPSSSQAYLYAQPYQHKSLASQYIPTIPMPIYQPSNNPPSGTKVNTEHYTPSMKATSLTNPPPPRTKQNKTSTHAKPSNQQHQPLPPPSINIISATSPHGPIKTASILTSPTDLQMASQHPKLSSMAPSSIAHKSQLKWAQSVVPTLASTTCPENNKFKYIPASASNNHTGGFQCSGGRHFISDALIASGSPGVYLLLDPNDTSYLAGPYFPSTTEKGMLLYAGEVPKVPPHAPDWIGGAYKGNFNARTGEKENVRIGRTVVGRASDRDILVIARGLGLVGVSAQEARRKCLEFVNSTG